MKVQEIKEIKENVSFESVTLLTAVVSGLFNLLVGAGKITMGLFMRSYFLCISGYDNHPLRKTEMAATALPCY